MRFDLNILNGDIALKKTSFILIGIIGIGILFMIDRWQISIHKKQIKTESTTLIDQCKIRLEGSLLTRFNAVESLASFFISHPDTNAAEFAQYAEKLMTYNRPIRALQYANSNTIVTYVYPHKRNEIAVNKPMKLITDPKRGPYVKNAIENKKATVHGPFELRQGGMGLILRSPIFSGDKFLGLAIGVFDVPDLIQEAFAGVDTSKILFKLINKEKRVFYGSQQTWKDALIRKIIVGDTQWLIEMKPFEKNRKGYYITRLIVITFGGGFIVFLLLFFHHIESQSQRLQILVKNKTEELIEKNQSLADEVSIRKRAEEDLIDREAKFRNIFNGSPIGIELYNTRGELVDLNPKCLEIFGVQDVTQVIGFNLFEDPNLSDEVKTRIKKGETVDYESVFDFDKVLEKNLYETEKRGKIFLQVYINTIKGDSNTVKGYLVHILNISERKEMESQKLKYLESLNEHKRLALVGKIAGKMAHDFNNILSIIMGTSELSILDCKDPELCEAFQLIHEQTLRGKNLTKNLVAFAKDQEPSLEAFSISEKIGLILNLMKKELKGIKLTREDKSNIPDIVADSGMIEHAIVNLLQNAIHSLSKTKTPKITIRTSFDKNHINFEIEDNGCGIPKEHINSIYEPAFTLKGSKDSTESYDTMIKGTGYGMANVKKYIDQHNGHILVRSKVRSGTKIIVSLPILKNQLTGQEKKKLKKTLTHFNNYILIVEDEIAISNIQYSVLTHSPCNHKVDVANNGQAAMDLLVRNSYDIVSLDYILPGKINGMDVYKFIRNTDKNLPILFVSGNIEFIESIKSLKEEDQFIDHVSKPCQNDKYISIINGLLSRASNQS